MACANSLGEFLVNFTHSDSKQVHEQYSSKLLSNAAELSGPLPPVELRPLLRGNKISPLS
jgi:hypothetical protein